MNSKSFPIILGILVIAILVFIGFRFLRTDFNLPTDGETKIETITAPDEGGDQITKEIMITNGVKHSISFRGDYFRRAAQGRHSVN